MDSDNATPIWLNLSTKQHIVDRNRLKPSKISVPHPLNTSSELRICLITADPQRMVKNAVAEPTFPTELSSQITRIIGLTKLKDRYKSFEQRRQLLSEHEIFLADDRIITRLPAVLGKIFYKGTSKRPIPIQIAAKVQKSEKQSKTTSDGSKAIVSPSALAKEIKSAVNAVPVSLKPGTMVSTRVGLETFTPEQLSANIAAVVEKLVEKHVVKGWRNVKAIHIKSPTSLALPIWLTNDLWTEDENVIEDVQTQDIEETLEGDKKRKRNATTTKGPQAGPRKKTRTEEADANRKSAERQTNSLRKERLAMQKAQALKDKSMVAI